MTAAIRLAGRHAVRGAGRGGRDLRATPAADGAGGRGGGADPGRRDGAAGRDPAPRGEPGRVLGAALGYGWSVAVAASPSAVLPAFERWAASDDPDVRRLVRENLGKARFARAAPDAVRRLAGG